MFFEMDAFQDYEVTGYFKKKKSNMFFFCQK